MPFENECYPAKLLEVVDMVVEKMGRVVVVIELGVAIKGLSIDLCKSHAL
jgi:hypothetical protein